MTPIPSVAVVLSQLGYGGAERQTVELLKELRGTMWAPKRVICLSDNVDPHGKTITELGYPLDVVPRRRAFDLRRIVVLRQSLVRDRITIVHAINWLAAAYALVAAPRQALVVTSIRNSRLPSSMVRRLALRYLVRQSAAVLVNSDRAYRLLRHDCRVSGDRLTLVRNGVDTERIRKCVAPGNVRRKLGIPAAAPLVAYVGRNAKVKNIPRLLAVVRRLLAERGDVHVVVAGNGLDGRIVAGGDLQGEWRLHCLGVCGDIPSLLCDANVLLLTSDSEGMPNVVLEAMAASVPVVSTPVGDLPDALSGRCGVVVAPDADRLAAATLEILANDRQWQPTFESDAREFVNRYSLPAMVVGTTTVWKETAARLR